METEKADRYIETRLRKLEAILLRQYADVLDPQDDGGSSRSSDGKGLYGRKRGRPRKVLAPAPNAQKVSS